MSLNLNSATKRVRLSHWAVVKHRNVFPRPQVAEPNRPQKLVAAIEIFNDVNKA